MRAVFVGGSEVAVMTARHLIDRGHEVVMIESDRARIDDLSDNLDCSFLQGDGSKPAILREAGPEQTDILFCLTHDDPINILASLVGRSLGFHRVVTSILNPEYEDLCEELGLADTIIPNRTISRYLADLAAGLDVLELRTAIKGDARLFQFEARAEDAGPVRDLDLPEEARVVCCYCGGQFKLVDEDGRINEGDEVVILTHAKNLPALSERWRPHTGEDANGAGQDKSIAS